MLIADRIRINYLLEFGTTSDWEDEFISNISQSSNLSTNQQLKLVDIYDRVRYGTIEVHNED